MSLPAYVDADRRLPDAEPVRTTLVSGTLTPFEDDPIDDSNLRAAAEDAKSSITDRVDRDRYSEAEEGANLRSFG